VEQLRSGACLCILLKHAAHAATRRCCLLCVADRDLRRLLRERFQARVHDQGLLEQHPWARQHDRPHGLPGAAAYYIEGPAAVMWGLGWLGSFEILVTFLGRPAMTFFGFFCLFLDKNTKKQREKNTRALACGTGVNVRSCANAAGAEARPWGTMCKKQLVLVCPI
jgi:hypothetical protein